MSIRTIPTYHSVPNFSIPPPERNGPIQLGTLLKDPRDPTPLNRNSRVPIPDEDIFPTHLIGFRTTTERQSGGEVGIFAKLLGRDGAGGNLSVNGVRSQEEILSVARLETRYFNPSLEYINRAIEEESIRAFFESSRYKKPLYLVTGIKIASGASTSVMRGRALGGGAGVGVPDPATSLVQLGAMARGETSSEDGIGFEDATDFVLGYRVSEVKKKKGGVRVRGFTRGATMVSDDVEEVVDGDCGELEVIHDFGSEADGVVVYDACKWVLHHS